MQHEGTPTSRTRRAAKQRAGRRGEVLVVGYDGSPACDAALRHAAARAGRTGRVVVAHVATGEPGANGEIRGRALLDSLLTDGCAPLMNIDFERELLAGDPAQELVATALEHEADEIIVGTPRRGSGLCESTAEALIRTAPIPLTLVPAEVAPAA